MNHHTAPLTGKQKALLHTARRQLGLDEHQVVKTLVMQDERAQPSIVLMHGDCTVSLKELARQTDEAAAEAGRLTNELSTSCRSADAEVDRTLRVGDEGVGFNNASRHAIQQVEDSAVTRIEIVSAFLKRLDQQVGNSRELDQRVRHHQTG